MILADKIIDLRKKNGWSQEELAEKLNVSRQAVSKWEGAQSVPDLDKILQMSRLFGVTTDYLIKDEQENAEYTPDDGGADSPRKVTLAEANGFLGARESLARPMALATFLCIVSPVCLMILSALSGQPGSRITENAAAGIGLCVLAAFVAAAVAIFIACGAKMKPFEYLDREPIETAYGVDGMVEERKEQFQGTAVRYTIFGTVLCILGAIPLFAGIAMNGEDGVFITAMVCVLLVLVGIGVAAFVLAGVRTGGFDRLLQQGDYTLKRKQNSAGELISSIYWPVVTAGYLAYSFITRDWGRSWIVWPVAGVLFAAIAAVTSAFSERKN